MITTAALQCPHRAVDVTGFDDVAASSSDVGRVSFGRRHGDHTASCQATAVQAPGAILGADADERRSVQARVAGQLSPEAA
jgi:hypothetical protein